MTDEPRAHAAPVRPAPKGRRFKPQSVELADGSTLVLGSDGSIGHIDSAGATTDSWAPDHPEWPDHAIRFGLHPHGITVAPHGRVKDTKPPRR